ncbi:MAG: putative glycolipid-binding domain-containing protein [Gaiellaceae bacterium]
MTAILWEFSEGGTDLCVLERADRGWRVAGTALLAAEGAPVEIRYAVEVSRAWVTEDAEVVVSFPGGEVRKPFEVGGLWSGKERPPEFRDCQDVDLGFTPATNTLPIRRLALDVGEEADVSVTWLRWPELRIERAEQHYARVAKDRYRFSSGDFSAELVVDEQGLVVDYEGLWRAIAREPGA